CRATSTAWRMDAVDPSSVACGDTFSRKGRRTAMRSPLGRRFKHLGTSDLAGAALPVGGADLVALDLAGFAARQGLGEVDAARSLELRHARGGEGDEFGLQRLAGLDAG